MNQAQSLPPDTLDKLQLAVNAWLAQHPGIQRQYAMGQFPIAVKTHGGLDQHFCRDVLSAALPNEWINNTLYANADEQTVDHALRTICHGRLPSNAC